MYRVAGVGQVASSVPATTTGGKMYVVGPRRVWTRGPGGRWRSVSKARLKAAGVGCACGCGDQCGMGQTATPSIANLPSDISTTLQDIFVNPDGSLNWAAVGMGGFVGILLFVNWGNTTKKRVRG